MNARTWTPEIVEIGDQIVGLSVACAAELVQYLEKVHGIKAGASPVVPPPPQPGIIDPLPVPTEFSVVLEGFDTAKKIGIIKAVRENTGFGIKEAKDFVEAVPKVVNDRLPKADAEKLKTKLEAAGAKITLKPVLD